MKNFEKSFYQTFKDILIVVNYDGLIVDLNEHSEAYFKTEKGRIVGKNIANFLPKNQFLYLFDKLLGVTSRDQFQFSMLINQKKKDFELSVLNDFNNNQFIICMRPMQREDLKFRKVFNNAHVGVVVHDENGAIINFNTHALKLLNVSKEQLLGLSSFDNSWKVVNEDLTPCEAEEMPSSISQTTGKIVKNKILGIVSSSMEIKWLSVSAVPVKNNKNKVIETFVTFNDVSEIKKVQSELLQLKAALDKTFIVTELDSNFTFKNVNNNFLETTKLKRTDCIDKHIIDVFPFWKEDNQLPDNLVNFKQGQFIVNEFSYRVLENDQRWFRGVSCPVVNEFGDLMKIYSIRMDVSAEKKSNLELKKMYSWQNALFEGTSYSFIATDINGTILTFNSSAEKMLGYKAEELINKCNPSLFHKYEEIESKTYKLREKFNEDIPIGFETFVYEAKKFGKEICEWTYVRKDKVELPIRLCVTNIFDENGKTIGFLGIAEDITEQKQMENMLDAQRAQVIAASKLSSLGELAAGIAHEINNPLAVILGKSSQLKRSIARNEYDIHRVEQEIIKIEKMSQRISKTIKGMKLFSRNGEFDSFEFKGLLNIVDDTYNICSEKFKDNLIEVNITVDPSVDILCRPTQISQVILNIINNAYDAMAEVSDKRILISTFEDIESLKIKIQDTGSGVPSSITDKIMEPFYTTKVNGKGTGIGLSISKKIVEEHGGRLYLDRNEKLTTFVLEFPIKIIKKHTLIAA